MLSNTHYKFEEELKQDILLKFDRFKEYQSLMLDVLADFHRVCMKNGIQYFLAYGSLLGAVRDGGQIPWDYDIDTWVHFEDKDRLFCALEKDLCKDYYFVCHYFNNSAYHRILRITPKGYNSEILHVDVFWLSGASEDSEINRRQQKITTIIRKVSFYKYCDMRFIGKPDSVLQIYYIKLKKLLSHFVPDSILDVIYDKYASIPSRKSKMIKDNDMLYVSADLFCENKLITLSNGMLLQVPKRYEEILSSLYGDYRRYLPLEARIREFITAISRIELLGK